jgi:hypothetical protein
VLPDLRGRETGPHGSGSIKVLGYSLREERARALGCQPVTSCVTNLYIHPLFGLIR